MKFLKALFALIGVVAALFAVFQFLSEYDVLKEPKEFVSDPVGHISKKNKEKQEKLVSDITERVGQKIDASMEKKKGPETMTAVFIGLSTALVSILLFLLVRYLYNCNRPRKFRHNESLYSDELWDDNQDNPDLYS